MHWIYDDRETGKDGIPQKLEERTLGIGMHACFLFSCRITLFSRQLLIKLFSNAVGSPFGDPCGKTCLEERDNQWLGVTLSRQPGENGSIVVGCWDSSLITS